MNALPLIVGAMCVMAIAYRYYSAFIAAKVLALDDARTTPAHTYHDGSNYEPTNKWVLLGHHFAAIAGAGPLIGPTLAAQFGYLPGFLWLLIGVVLAGAVHDFVSLAASIRRGGRSLADIAHIEISPVAGIVTTVAILIIIVVSMAGLGLAVVNALVESSWGTFTIAMTIPIALFIGFWMRFLRPGRVGEASIIGIVGVLAAVIGGSYIPGTALAPFFTFTREELIILIAIYGFAASVLPVWMLMVPRDYISSYMKVGTVFVLIVGVIIVAPDLKMPAVTEFVHGNGPIIPGTVFPFMFITIACGAISGFHSLVATGTTPKLINKESDARMIGYGGMLMEGIVGIVALIAATALHPADYYAINLPPQAFAALGLDPVNLALLSEEVGEQVAGRPGGAVSLAVGFAQIFTALPGMASLMSYWYHFAIMFEALFILTTIDTGTRIGRFLLQEYVGKLWKPFQRTNWIPGSVISTSLIVYGWAYFIWNGSISMIWPMFGTANQLLAGVALSIGTSYIINSGKHRYAWITLVPMLFVTTTTLTAGYFNIIDNFWPLTQVADKASQGYVNSILTSIMMVCAVIVLIESLRKWYRVIFLHHDPYAGQSIGAPRMSTMVIRCC